MNFVEPIRDRKKIAQIKNLLRGQKRFRDLLLFVVGINTALRISDLLQLQIDHFLDEQGRIKSRFWIKERKRGKRHEVVINTSIRELLEEYLPEFPDIGKNSDNFVFFSSTTHDYSIPISAARLGNSSRPFVVRQDYLETSAPTVFARPGGTMPGCKV